MRLVVVAGVLAMLPGTAGFVVSGFSSGANVAINTMMVGPLLACGRETSLYLQPIRDAKQRYQRHLSLPVAFNRR